LPKLVKKTRASGGAPPSEELLNAIRISSLAADHKAKDIRAYDVRGLTVVADSFVICTAGSQPQMRAIFNAVKEGMKEFGVASRHTEGTFHSGWLIMDYGDVIFHVFREEAREFYDLDGFWADAPQLAMQLEG
jgi:ribosome-associated protein